MQPIVGRLGACHRMPQNAAKPKSPHRQALTLVHRVSESGPQAVLALDGSGPPRSRAARRRAATNRSSESMVSMSRMRGSLVPQRRHFTVEAFGTPRSLSRSRNASSVTERFARRHGWLTALPAAQVGGRNADHHLRLQQPSGRVDECDDLCELFGDSEVGLGGGLKPVDVSIGEAQRQWPGAFDLGQVEVSRQPRIARRPRSVSLRRGNSAAPSHSRRGVDIGAAPAPAGRPPSCPGRRWG